MLNGFQLLLQRIHRVSVGGMKCIFKSRSVIGLTVFFTIAVFAATAQDQNDTLPQRLKMMSMEELMNLEVTSVSKRSEKLNHTASAIQVITGDEIRRSGASNIPEALRLATNLQVEQLQSNAWLISARGFNALYSNKLLVMIDGRNTYSPLFAGVLWDVQNIMIEDVERIEVISGPGGTMWGANAVNGVVNIVTKRAEDTQGFMASVAGGNHLERTAGVRYGGEIGKNISYRVFAQHDKRAGTENELDIPKNDAWEKTYGGFRLAWDLTEKDQLRFIGNMYGGALESEPESSTFDGQNIIARYTHTFSPSSEIMVEAFYDRTWREDIPSSYTDQLQTVDVDIQHQFSLKRHKLVWGGGYRWMESLVRNSTNYAGFKPNLRTLPQYDIFFQDEVEIIPQNLFFTIGSKLQHNVFTGFEVQPNARLSFLPGSRHNIWAAVSRAVRSPSRIDVDLHIPVNPLPIHPAIVDGGPDFISEELTAYELGYRVQPANNLSLSISGFYNNYDNLFSVEAIPEDHEDALPDKVVYQIRNSSQGFSTGFEFKGTWQVAPNMRLRGGYTFFYKELTTDAPIYPVWQLGLDPSHQFLLHYMLDVTDNLHFDVVCRGKAMYEYGLIEDYLTFDVSLSWEATKWLQLSAVGQNLGEDHYHGYVSPTGVPTKIEPRFYGRITCRL